MVMKITVKTLDSQNYQFDAQDDWTVAQFKEHIKDTVNIEPTEQRLIFCGRVLQNDKKLTDYDCHEKVIHLVRRPPPSTDENDRDSSVNATGHRESGSSYRTNDINRLSEDGNLILSAMTLGTDGNVHDIVRQIISLQQAIHHRPIDDLGNLQQGSSRLGLDLDRRLNNLNRLIGMTRAQILECNNRISQINQAPRPTINPTSSHSDLSRDAPNDTRGDNSESSSRSERTSSFASSTGQNFGEGTTRSEQRRVSLTTDDLPQPTSSTRLSSTFLPTNSNPNQRVDNQNQSTRMNDELSFERYINSVEQFNELQTQIQTLVDRYREVLLLSRRGGLIVSDRTNFDGSRENQERTETQSTATSSGEQQSETADSGRQVSSVFHQEARILSHLLPRIMHTHSHVLHALSDLSVDVSNGRLLVQHPTLSLHRSSSTRSRDATRRSARAEGTQTSQPASNRYERANEPIFESSVTITATTVETTPIMSSTTSMPGSQPQTSATIVVTSEPNQAGVHIPISIPMANLDTRDIQFNFTTPQVPPPTQEHSRDSSASRNRDGGPEGSSDSQTAQQQRRQESASTQTSSTTTPFGVITSFVPAPFDPYLNCYSRFATNHGHRGSNARQVSGTVPEARVQFRVPRLRATVAPQTNEAQNREQVNQRAASVGEVVGNILGSLFRPSDNQPTAQSAAPTNNTNQEQNAHQRIQDPILSMIPELALQTVSQLIGEAFGLPAGQQSSRAASGNQQTANQTASRAQAPVMMDIDIDDSSSSRSESPYHDASDVNRLSSDPQTQSSFYTSQPSSSRQVPPNASQPPAISSRNITPEQFGLVWRTHRDWIPIIEADMSYLEDHASDSNGPQYFSDAYLSSIPRKRRRLLTARPERVIILQPSPSEAISDLLRRAISNSNVQFNSETLDPVISSIASDEELQAAYEEHLKTVVEARLRSDDDYNPEKFENSRKYFNP